MDSANGEFDEKGAPFCGLTLGKWGHTKCAETGLSGTCATCAKLTSVRYAAGIFILKLTSLRYTNGLS